MSRTFIIFSNKTVQQSVVILHRLEQYCNVIEYISPSTKALIKAHVDKIKFFIDTADFDNPNERREAKTAINLIRYYNKTYNF